jgi:hypothetical protein
MQGAALAASTDGARHEYGPAVVDGRLIYVSPSSITKFDASQFGGCERRWYAKYVMGLEETTTAAQTSGKEEHSQLEHYLKTGDLTLGRIALSARRFIPLPGPGLLVEHSIEPSLTVLSGALPAAGVPIIGYIDLLNLRGEYHDSVGVLRAESLPDTVEILDWKTTSNPRFAKSGRDLLDTVQMVTYGGLRAQR